MGRNQRDEPVQQHTYTNWTSDPSIDCNGAVAVVGDGLGTIVDELIKVGVLSGTVSA